MKQRIFVAGDAGTMEFIPEVTAEESGHSRLKELVCVMTDHQWNEIRQETSDGVIVHRSSKCSFCGLHRVAEK